MTKTARMLLAVVVPAALVLGACGGGDDDETAETTAPASTAAAPVVTQPLVTAPPITVPTVTTPAPVAYVTAGANVMVTNASRVDGGAGRLSERLAVVGFTVVVSMAYVLVNLTVDLAYMMLDPRIKEVG